MVDFAVHHQYASTPSKDHHGGHSVMIEQLTGSVKGILMFYMFRARESFFVSLMVASGSDLRNDTKKTNAGHVLDLNPNFLAVS